MNESKLKQIEKQLQFQKRVAAGEDPNKVAKELGLKLHIPLKHIKGENR